MGGMGSGRRYQGGKSTTSDYRRIDIRQLQRGGHLVPGYSLTWRWSRKDKTLATIQIMVEADRLILKYNQRVNGGEWEAKEYPVYLEWTGCNQGGKRAWFLCPANGCGRRVAILYSGQVFACRHCLKLAYESQRENAEDQMTRRANKIRARLKWEAGILNGNGWKPKGMHWRTYQQLTAQYDQLVGGILQSLSKRLGLFENRLEAMNRMADLYD
jgi:hypothetical protein